MWQAAIIGCSVALSAAHSPALVQCACAAVRKGSSSPEALSMATRAYTSKAAAQGSAPACIAASTPCEWANPPAGRHESTSWNTTNCHIGASPPVSFCDSIVIAADRELQRENVPKWAAGISNAAMPGKRSILRHTHMQKQ
jgi:hypothetical protein